MAKRKRTNKKKSNKNKTRKSNPTTRYKLCEKKNCRKSMEKEKNAYEKNIKDFKIKCPNDYTPAMQKCRNDLYNISDHRKAYLQNTECTTKYCSKERIGMNNSSS